MSDPMRDLTNYLLEELSGLRSFPEQARVSAEQIKLFVLKNFANELPWRPIAELNGPDGKYDHKNDGEAGLLLLAPELVDEDCNTHGVGMGYYQDDGKAWGMTKKEFDAVPEGADLGSWMACKWSMTNDEWSHVCCTPTHYLRLTGVKP